MTLSQVIARAFADGAIMMNDNTNITKLTVCDTTQLSDSLANNLHTLLLGDSKGLLTNIADSISQDDAMMTEIASCMQYYLCEHITKGVE